MSIKQTNTADINNQVMFPPTIAGGTEIPTTPTPVVTRKSPTPTLVDSRKSPTPTPVDSGESPTPTPVDSGESPTPTPLDSQESPTSTTEVNITPPTVSTTTTVRNTSNSSPTPSGPHNFSRNHFNTHPDGKLPKTQNKNVEITATVFDCNDMHQNE